MREINQATVRAIRDKTPYSHSAEPHKEGLTEAEIKGLFYKAITDEQNSVIAEINRVVKEGNAEIAQIDASFSAGKLEAYPSSAIKTQSFISMGAVVCFYGEIPSYTLQELGALATAFSLNQAGEYLFLRLYAPAGVVPDNGLQFTVGNIQKSGFSALSSSAEEGANGVYYLDFCFTYAKNKRVPLYVKWKQGDSAKILLLDFCDYYMQATKDKLFVRFAANASGENISATWNESRPYMGVFSGAEASTDPTDYTWVRINEAAPVQKTVTLLSSGWSNGQQTIQVSEVGVNSFVICSPSPQGTSHALWASKGIRCLSQGAGTLTFTTRETPASDVSVHLLIGG